MEVWEVLPHEFGNRHAALRVGIGAWASRALRARCRRRSCHISAFGHGHHHVLHHEHV